MNHQALKQQVCAAVDAMAADLREISLFLHSHPELGGGEVQAARLLTAKAAQSGFAVQTPISGYPTAFIARKGQCEPKIAFLAEYDALPGLGHACGHNLIAAMSWGAAAAFAAVAGTKATACFIGCPAEETDGAKVAMAADGVFDDLTAAFIVHPADGNYIGGSSYASHPLSVTFHGRSAHVADQPDRGVNALDALVTFYQTVKTLQPTFTQPTILAGIITNGGVAPNIVPAEAEARFTIRALRADYLETTVLPAVKQLAADIARQTNTTVTTVHYEPLFKELRNDPRLLTLYRQNLSLLGETAILLPPESADGSTDVGNVSHAVPTIHPDINISRAGPLTAHTPEFAAAARLDHALTRVLVGAKAMAMTAVDLLG